MTEGKWKEGGREREREKKERRRLWVRGRSLKREGMVWVSNKSRREKVMVAEEKSEFWRDGGKKGRRKGWLGLILMRLMDSPFFFSIR